MAGRASSSTLEGGSFWCGCGGGGNTGGGARRIHGRSAVPGNWNFGGRAFCAGGTVISRGDQGSRKDYRDEHGGVDAGRTLLWVYGHGGRDSGADEESDGRENESDRDGRA